MRPQQIFGWFLLLGFLGFMGWKLFGELDRIGMDDTVLFFVFLILLLVLFGVRRVLTR